jgi:hypothetical protein
MAENGIMNCACKYDPVYIITEEVHHAAGWGYVTVGGKNAGFDVLKVTRKIVQPCVEQEVYIDDEKKMPTDWDYIKDFLGLAVIEYRGKPNAKINPVLVYSGFRNIGEVLGARKNIPTPQIFVYGTDPIPHIKLYGNKAIKFHTIGGQGSPKAVAIYDLRNKAAPLKQVELKDQQAMIDLLTARVELYR